MKRILIYVLLSIVVVVPIAVVLTMILSMDYTEEFSYIPVKVKNNSINTETMAYMDVEEVKTVTAYFGSNSREIITYEYRLNDQPVLMCSEGDYIHIGDVLCKINKVDKLSEFEGIVERISVSDSEIIFAVLLVTVDNLTLNIPVDLCTDINDSRVILDFGENQYEFAVVTFDKIADSNGNMVVYYSVPSDLSHLFVYGGRTTVKFYSGRRVTNVLMAPKKCIYYSPDGYYYMELVTSSGQERVTVELGIESENYIHVISDKELDDTMEFTINPVNVFSVDEGIK